MLATGDNPPPVREENVQFSTDATLGEVIQTVIANALGQFVANWPAMTETSHPESIHQMHVAVVDRALLRGFSIGF